MDDALPLTLFAPAKINLYLHLTGRRDDGYHLLDSLSLFIDQGDRLQFTPADQLSLTITGPFAPAIAGDDAQNNLVWRAAQGLADHVGRAANVAITLEKNIPPGAGLGGGSADAAATVKGLLQLWGISEEPQALQTLLLSLGSDVPACYAATPVIIQGVGDQLAPGPSVPNLPMVVVYPGQPSSTPAAYKGFQSPFSPAPSLPASFGTAEELAAFLHTQTHNDLYPPARTNVPVIDEVLSALKTQDNLLLARMSGSGSACFALFRSREDAQRAAETISRSCPHWWVRHGGLWFPH